MTRETHDMHWSTPLTQDEFAQIAGGRMKIPGTGLERYEVYYDDGVSISTNKPGCSNVHPVIT